jgi:hypothetical protein
MLMGKEIRRKRHNRKQWPMGMGMKADREGH